ncbi:uncharacterized protein LOC113759609 [Coffea eugenioides]|uniref:uncharacterized protein LOC113759609 n=1 Tax=Coffea eugenioides TaxID=49369 RepID=UPI000F604E31|nr:uncharacterized protein LOC113759609 [Coffea eugenioides]
MVPQKLKLFIWKCLHGILPVNVLVRDRCSRGDWLCRCCRESQETLEHMFFFCSNATTIWEATPLCWDGLESFRSKFWFWWEELKDAVKKERGKDRVELTVHLLWHIWKSRNGMQFNKKRRDPRTAVNKAVVGWREYHEAQLEEAERVDGSVKKHLAGSDQRKAGIK